MTDREPSDPGPGRRESSRMRAGCRNRGRFLERPSKGRDRSRNGISTYDELPYETMPYSVKTAASRSDSTTVTRPGASNGAELRALRAFLADAARSLAGPGDLPCGFRTARLRPVTDPADKRKKW